MKHLYYTFSLYVKSDTVSRRKFQYHRTDKMKELTVLSDLMPRHMLTLILWASKPSLWVQVWHFRVSPFLSGHSGCVWQTITLVHGVFDAWASELCTTHRDCGRAAGYEGSQVGDHSVQRVTLAAQECHKAGLVLNCRQLFQIHIWASLQAFFFFFFNSFIYETQCFSCFFLFLSQWSCGGCPMAFQGSPKRRSSGERGNQKAVGDRLSCPGAQESHAHGGCAPWKLGSCYSRMTVVGLWHLNRCSFHSVLVCGFGFGLLSKLLHDSPSTFLWRYIFE